MKTKLAFWAFVSVLVAFNIATIAMLRKNASDLQRLRDNQESLMTDSNTTVKLDIEEFRKLLDPLLDSLEQITGIKTKQVTNVTKVYNTYNDTNLTIYHAPTIAPGLYNISYTDSCWGFVGTFSTTDSTTAISRKYYNDLIIKYGFTQRDRLWNKKWAPRWGHKRAYVGAASRCNASVKVQEIDLAEPP